MTIPQVVIMAGGLGTRLGSEYSGIPKILAPINGRPFLRLQLEKFEGDGVKNVHYLLGHGSNLVVDELKTVKSSVDISFTIEPSDLLGTGGALMNAMDDLEDTFILTYGDSLLMTDFSLTASKIRSLGYLNAMLVAEIADIADVPNVFCQGNKVQCYGKNSHDPRLNKIDYGLLWLDKATVSEFITHEGKFDLEDVFNFLIECNQLYSIDTTDHYFDIGSPSRIRKLEVFLNGKVK